MAYTPVAERSSATKQTAGQKRLAELAVPGSRYTGDAPALKPSPTVKRAYVPVAERVQGPKPETQPVKGTPTKKPGRTGFQTFMDVTAGKLFSGVAGAAGAAVEGSTKALNPFNYVGAQLGRGVYKGLGALTGMVDDDAGEVLGKLGDRFYQDMRGKYKEVARSSTDINRFFTEGGAETERIITRDTQEAQYRGRRSEAFTAKDLKDPQFWLYDAYGSLVENAPTMILSIYTGGKVGFPASYGRVAQWLSKAAGSTAFSTTLNAARESESAYNLALEEGVSEEEAYRSGERVFRRNLTGNSAFEAIQMLTLFGVPQVKLASPFLRALMQGGSIVGAGGVEALQERGEDAIQAQARSETFDFDIARQSVLNPSISKTDVISALMGMFVQGSGNVFLDEDRTKEEFEDQAEEVLARIHPDVSPPAGPAAVAALEQEVQMDPRGVEDAYREVAKERKAFVEQEKKEAIDDIRIEKNGALVRTALASGESPAMVALRIAGEAGVDKAVAFVNQVAAEMAQELEQTKPEEQQPDAPKIEDKTAADIDADFGQLLEAHEQESAALRRKVEEAATRVKEAEPRTNEKKQAKLALEEVRKELRALEKEQGDRIETATGEIRASLEKLVEGMGTGLPVGEIVDTVLERSAEPDAADVPLRQLVEEAIQGAKPAKKAVKKPAQEKKARDFVRGDVFDGKAYRVETGYKHGKGITAADVVRYEQDELGNDYGIEQNVLDHLNNYPASAIRWVTRAKKDALRYGKDVVEVQGEGLRVVAVDGDGGYLLLDETAGKPATAEEAAERYWNEVLQPEINKKRAVVIGADDLKDYFGNDYDTARHPVYSGAANLLYERALKEVKDPLVKFTVGGTGSGKSDFVVEQGKVGFAGIIYDSTGWKYDGTRDQIDKATAAGKSIKVYGIIPDIRRARAYTFLRELRGEHPVTETAFVRTHSGAINTMIRLIDDGFDVLALDTRNVFSKEDAANAEFQYQPRALLEEVWYTESNVKDLIKDITKENAAEIISQAKREAQRSREEGAGNVPAESGTDKGLNHETDNDTRGGDQQGSDAGALRVGKEGSGDADRAASGTDGGDGTKGRGERNDNARKRPSARSERLSNEEIDRIVSAVTQITASGEVLTTGEVTDEVLEAANQYQPGGASKKGRGVLDEYYTHAKIVEMVKSLVDFSTANMRVIEPSVGTGNFLYAIPEAGEHKIAGLEINPTVARIAKILHPTVKVFNKPFEVMFVDERGGKIEMEDRNRADLILGNPPYGEHRGEYLGLGEEPKIKKYEEYFLKRGIDMLKEGGTLIMVIPSGFLRGATNTHAKFTIPKSAELTEAYRLPNGVFEGTDIGTDIVVFKKSKAKSDKVRLERNKLLNDDAYFKAHPEHVLGTPSIKSGRFGDEAQVIGTLDDAMARFESARDVSKALKTLNDLGIATTPENVETAEAAVEEAGEKKAKELVKEDQKAKERGKKTIDKKIVKKATKKGAPVSLSKQYDGGWSDVELSLWKATLPDGSLDIDSPAFNEAATKTAEANAAMNLYKGKWYLNFNYAQGDIYEKLEQLEREDGITKAKKEEQRKKLLAVLPAQETVEDLRISPNVSFVKDLVLEKDGEKETTLRSAFMSWAQKLPRKAFGDSSEWEVRAYVLDQQVRGNDKDLNERVRIRRKRMAESLFTKFLAELSPEHKKLVAESYNRTFNFYHTPDYSMVPMFSEIHGTFKGKPFVLNAAQKEGIGRLVNTGVGILAHEVGFGKTISGILAMHETMQRGWAKRPLIVAPSENVYRQWADTINDLIPDAKLNLLGNLGAGYKGDLSELSIPDGSITLVTYEGFKRLSFKDETYTSMADKFKYIADDLNSAPKTERQREKAKQEAKRIGGAMKKGTRADLFFEDLGFDLLTFDEAHNANHIVSKVKLEKGQASEFNRFSLRTSDLGLKTWLASQYIQERTGGRNVHLLSATPFTNHPLEYFSVLSLVADQSLKKMGFDNVNDFFGTFMEAENEYEFKADGTYQKKTDIRRFRNYRQFRKLLDTYIDFKQDAPGIKRPNRVQITYEVPKNELTRGVEVQAQPLFKDKESAGILRAITELRKAAFSPYASKFSAPITPTQYVEFVENSPKLKTLAAVIAQNKKDAPDAGQIVYSEVGVEFFPMLKQYFVKELGYKADEVEIITGATSKNTRISIQERYNAGKVKILLGSEAISEGMNLQENTTDMHLLSLPWNFTALRQVVGRAWRQGNRWKNVRINQYFIQDSVDVFLSQKLDNKQKRFESALASNASEVDVGDVTYAEMKFDLVQDPETRAKLELQARKDEISNKIVQAKAETAFAARKLEKLNSLLDDIRQNKEFLAQEEERLGTDPDNADTHTYWIKQYTKDLISAEKDYKEELEKLKNRGVDTESLLKTREKGEREVTALEAELKGIDESFSDRVKEIAASMPPRQDFSKATVDAFVAERAQQNKTFYQLAEIEEKKAKLRAFENTERQEIVGRDEAVAYLADVKQRLNLSFDAYFFDTILAGYKLNPFTKQKTGIEAWGATLDNTVALLKTMEQYTPHHEVGHLVLGNIEKIPTFSKRNITRAKLMRAQAEKMGIAWSKATDGQIEEAMMRDFEQYLQHKHAPKGILRTFFVWLKEQLVRVARAINLTKGDIVQDYYDILDEGKAVGDTMVRLENTGVIEAFQDEGILDMDLAESALTRFKIVQDGDARYQKLQKTYNELAEKHAKLEADTEEWRNDIVREIEVKKSAERENASTSEDVKASARFIHRKVPPIGDLTEAGRKEIKTKFADPEKAEAEVRDYLKRKVQLVQSRNALRDLRRKITDSKGAIKSNKQTLRDLERRLKLRKRLLERADFYIDRGIAQGKKEHLKLIRSRQRLVSDYAEQFAIGDKRMKTIIGNKKIHLMTERQFDDFLVEFANKAQQVGNTLTAQDELRAFIQEQQLQKWENLQKAMHLPAIDKMKEYEARRFLEVLSQYQFGDVFLTQRMLETIHRTNWGEIKTEREMYTKMRDVMGIGAGELATLEPPPASLFGGRGGMTPWIKLARLHPFYNWLVGRRVQADIQATQEYYQIERVVNELSRKARASRRKRMGLKERAVEAIVPTDDIVFGYLEAENKASYAKEKGMTEEERTFGDYLILQYHNAYEYLRQEHGMSGRKNYMTHMRRTFLETIKDGALKEAFAEMLSSQKEDEAAFKILEEQTGEVLAFEKFFKYALRRTGGLVPTKNVTRAVLAYYSALTKKRALDSLVPEAMVATRAYEALKGTTEKGLEKDPTVTAFVKRFLNNAKGRHIDFGPAQGSSNDVRLRMLLSWVSFKYLGFNMASAIANIFGDFAATSLVLSNRELARGAVRSFNLKHASEINEQYQFFTGRNPFVEIADPRYNLPQRFWRASMSLMAVASFQSQKFFLRAKMSEQEWQTGVVEHERLVEIANALSRVKPNPFYVKSLAGNTTVGSGATQFMSWAFPIWNSTTSDATQVIQMLKDKKSWDEIRKAEEWQMLSRTVLRMGVLGALAMLFAGDDDDDTWTGQLKRKVLDNINTGLIAIAMPLNPANYGLALQELKTLYTLLVQLVTMEEYQRDGTGYDEGDLKALNTAERFVTPSVVRQIPTGD